jgi:uncharacterized membrane protein/glutaredoxin
MLTVTIYGRADCPLCEKALEDLNELQEQFPHRLVEIDIEEEGLSDYIEKIPVIETGPYQIQAPFDKQKIQITLGAAQDRLDQLENIDLEGHQKRIEKGKTFNTGDRVFYWLSRRYMILFNLFAFMYVGLAFLAPVLLSAGRDQSANLIYNVYGRLCHQLAYRSWFIYGDQNAYPRELAGIDGLMTYEEATGLNPSDVDAAIDFRGNQQLGFKTALCQRDVAIYGSILLFGLIFSITKRKIPYLPFIAWVVLGLVPIGLDGLSQIVSQLPWEILPVRESTPLLRSITGLLFGFSTAWFSYPVIEEAMSDTRKVLSVKLRASQMSNKS